MENESKEGESAKKKRQIGSEEEHNSTKEHHSKQQPTVISWKTLHKNFCDER
jgi:hypothetical protein